MIYDEEKKDLYWHITGLEHELKRYRDIEKKLGIAISTLLNMQLYGKFYVKLEDGEIEKAHKQKNEVIYFSTPHFGIMIKYKAYRFFCYHLKNYYFADYGKTWALTREELENDDIRSI